MRRRWSSSMVNVFPFIAGTLFSSNSSIFFEECWITFSIIDNGGIQDSWK